MRQPARFSSVDIDMVGQCIQKNTLWDMTVGVAQYFIAARFSQGRHTPHEIHITANRRILPVKVGGITHLEAA